MDENVVILIIQMVVLIGIFVYNKFFVNVIPKDTIEQADKIVSVITQYADAFVMWARYFKSNKPGDEKMEAVVSQLTKVASKYGIEMDKDELTAIAQKSYEKMKQSSKALDDNSKQAEAAVKVAEANVKQAEVNIAAAVSTPIPDPVVVSNVGATTDDNEKVVMLNEDTKIVK